MPENVMRNYAWMGRSSASTDGWFGGRQQTATKPMSGKKSPA